MTLQLDIASMKLTSAITSAAGSNATHACQLTAGSVSSERPAGISPTTAPPCAAKPKLRLKAISANTVTNTPGHFGSQRLKPSNSATATMPSSNVMPCNCGQCPSNWTTPSKVLPPGAMSMPVKAGSCDSAITSAEALTKPTNTGCDSRLSKIPARANPRPNWISPDSSANSST